MVIHPTEYTDVRSMCVCLSVCVCECAHVAFVDAVRFLRSFLMCVVCVFIVVVVVVFGSASKLTVTVTQTHTLTHFTCACVSVCVQACSDRLSKQVALNDTPHISRQSYVCGRLSSAHTHDPHVNYIAVKHRYSGSH